MVRGQGCVRQTVGRGVVVGPGVGCADVSAVVEPVPGAVVLGAAALGHHLNLAANGTGEVGGLVEARDLKLFNALHGSGHYAGGRAVGLSAAGTGEVSNIAGIVTGHVGRFIAAI